MSEEPRRISKAAIIAAIIILLGIIAVLLIIVFSKNTVYTSWETKKEYTNISGARFLRTRNGYVAYNRDGAEGHSLDGDVSWKISYQLNDPVAAASTGYAAFADRGGQLVHVADYSGANYSFEVSEKIVEICVADQGVTAVRTDDTDSDRIYLYDLSGNLLLDMRTDVRKAGFPIAMALSGDGKKLVTSYFKAGQENKTWLTFYNFGDVGQNYSDKIVGSFSYDEDIIIDIRFLNDSRVAVFYSNGCDLYKLREVPELIRTLSFDGGISAICESGTGFAIARKDENGAVSVTVYDLNGKELSTVNSSIAFDSMSLEGDELILTLDDTCVIYSKNGNEKFRARFSDAIRLVCRGSNQSEYLIVGEDKTKEIRLRTLKEDAADAADE